MGFGDFYFAVSATVQQHACPWFFIAGYHFVRSSRRSSQEPSHQVCKFADTSSIGSQGADTYRCDARARTLKRQCARNKEHARDMTCVPLWKNCAHTQINTASMTIFASHPLRAVLRQAASHTPTHHSPAHGMAVFKTRSMRSCACINISFVPVCICLTFRARACT